MTDIESDLDAMTFEQEVALTLRHTNLPGSEARLAVGIRRGEIEGDVTVEDEADSTLEPIPLRPAAQRRQARLAAREQRKARRRTTG